MATNENNLIVTLLARDKMTKPIKRVQSSVIRFVGAISASLAAFKAVSFPITQAIDFDRAMRDVQKTTGFTDIQIAKLSADLNNLATSLSVSQEELAQIAAVGGQLGIGSAGVESVRQFTESIARAKVTLGLTAEEAAKLGAQLLNIFSVDISQIENVISTVNELTNNSVANAKDLGDIMTRIGSIAGLTLQQVGALSAYLRDLGVSVEVAGTSMVKVFTNMSTKAEKFAAVMGISTQEWVDLLTNDALDALKKVLTSVSKLDAVSKATTIKDIFGGGRIFATISKLVNGTADDFARLNDLLAQSNTAFAFGTSSVAEYENILRSVKEQFVLVGNAFSNIGIEIGNKLLPDLERLAKAMQDFLKGAGKDFLLELGNSLSDASKYIEELITSIVNSDVAWGAFVDKVKTVLTVIGSFLALELGAHLVYLAGQWYKVGKAVFASGKNVTSVAAKYLGLVKASTDAANAEVANAGRVTKAYREQQRAIALSIQEYKKQNLKLGNAEAVGRNKTSADAISAGFKDLSKEQQAAIITVSKARAKAIKIDLGLLRKQQAAEKARWAGTKKILDAEVAAQKKGTKAYENALYKRDLVTDVHRRKLATLRAQISRNSARLRGYNTVIDSNTISLERNIRQMARSVGVSNRLAVSVGRLAVAAPKAAGAFILLGKGLTKLGQGAKAIVGFFGSWPALLIEVASAIYIFWDDITSLFSEKTNKISEAAARASREELRKLQDEAIAAVAALEQFSKKAATVIADNLRNAFNAENFKQVSVEANKVFSSLGQTAQAAVGAEVNQALFGNLIDQANQDAREYGRQIDAIKKKIEQLTFAQKQLKGALPGAVDNYAPQIAGLNEDMLALTKQYDEAIDRVKTFTKEQDKALQKSIEAEQAATNQIAALADTNQLPQEVYDVISSYRDMLVLKEKQAVKEKEIEDLTTKQKDNAEKFTTEEKKRLRILSAQAAKLKLQQESILENKVFKKIEELPASMASLFSNVQKITNAADVDKLIQLIDAFVSKRGSLQNIESINKKTLEHMRGILFAQAGAEREAELFAEQLKPAKDTLKEIGGIIDNMPKTLEKVRNDTRKLVNDLNDFLDARAKAVQEASRTNVQNQKDQNAKNRVNDVYGSKIQAEQDRAASAGRPVNDQYIKRLEKYRDAELKNIETQRKAADAQDNANRKRQEAAKAINDLNGAQNKLADLEGKLLDLSKEDNLTTKENRARLIKLKAEYDDVSAGVKDYATKAKKAIEDLGNIKDVKPRWPGDLNGELIVTAQELNNLRDRFQESLGGQEATVKKIRDAFIELKTAAETSFKNIGGELAAAVTGYKKQVKEFTAGLNEENKKIVAAQLEYFRGLFAKLKGEFSDIGQQIKDASAGQPGGANALSNAIQKTGKLDEKTVQIQLDIVNGDKFTNLGKTAAKLFGTEIDSIFGTMQDQFNSIQLTPDTKYLYEQLNNIRDTYFKGDNAIKADIDAIIRISNKEDLKAAGVDIKASEAQKRATGGFIKGPGTPTSDSILSWLSNGEYVIQASAVSHYGKWLLDAINGRMLPRFATGGAVDAGSVSRSYSLSGITNNFGGTSGTPVVIQMPGGNNYSLSGERNEVDRLKRDLMIEVLKRGDVT